ncbi:TPA: hypothetical protein I7126_23335 [Vibrio vulnificus]|uniref:hypothetical protein n=1 Tax=Vibrio sp. MMG023 TaxID=2909979 RepID=UPI001A258EC1|nr:hypothetical protein [Vibrio sp. MMG023]MCF6455110.1 hypothetical protein [Vibrio sp. MMG023]HAS6031993.1 hypothetical protein [Vibrio vulnificus]HAS6116993.1 hypothetical protein [Vibrio vulnificus]HAS6126509.1 hypothetical protein [Vibrio vulnificus]
MNKNLEKFLREHCNLINWNPTPLQLKAIQKEIEEAIANGKRLSRSDCQHIVVKHCGSTEMMLLDSVDNSDLNTLLSLATKKDADN